MNKNMLLVSSTWKDKPTFKLIPTTTDCPYNEVIFDYEQKILAVISKEKKDSYHMMPKLNDVGDLIETKPGKRPQGKIPYAEQRVTLETYYEYFISNKKEIVDFVNMIAVNNTQIDITAIVDEAFLGSPAVN